MAGINCRAGRCVCGPVFPFGTIIMAVYGTAAYLHRSIIALLPYGISPTLPFSWPLRVVPCFAPMRAQGHIRCAFIYPMYFLSPASAYNRPAGRFSLVVRPRIIICPRAVFSIVVQRGIIISPRAVFSIVVRPQYYNKPARPFSPLLCGRGIITSPRAVFSPVVWPRYYNKPAGRFLPRCAAAYYNMPAAPLIMRFIPLPRLFSPSPLFAGPFLSGYYGAEYVAGLPCRAGPFLFRARICPVRSFNTCGRRFFSVSASLNSIRARSLKLSGTLHG